MLNQNLSVNTLYFFWLLFWINTDAVVWGKLTNITRSSKRWFRFVSQILWFVKAKILSVHLLSLMIPGKREDQNRDMRTSHGWNSVLDPPLASVAVHLHFYFDGLKEKQTDLILNQNLQNTNKNNLLNK